jgi:formate hydrogenlyase subunit 6/NADH:ubiquinone oxidoreductase subunit I
MKVKKSLKIGAEIGGNLFRRALTVRFPKESLEIPKTYRGEHEFDGGKCRGCSLCANICPNKAIRMVETVNGRRPEIDLSKCCFCGLCEDVCPSKALRLTEELPRSVRNPSTLIKSPRKERGKAHE